MNSDDSSESAFEFPCDFPIKVMGLAAEDFDSVVVEIVMRHVGDLNEGAVVARSSRNGKYVSVTVTFRAQGQEQLDDLYRELSGHARIIMVL